MQETLPNSGLNERMAHAESSRRELVRDRTVRLFSRVAVVEARCRRHQTGPLQEGRV